MILRDVPLSPKYGFMLVGKSEHCKSKGQAVYCRCARQFQYRVKSKSNRPGLWTEKGKGGWWVEKTSRSGEAVSQLVDPDPNKTAFLTGLRLPIVDDLGFRVPHDLCRVFEPFSESNNQVNLTPKHSFVDLHIGKLDT